MSRLPPRQLAVLQAIRRAEISGAFLTRGLLCVLSKTNHHRLKRLHARGLIVMKGRDAPLYTTEAGRAAL